ncbi:N-acetylmuramoyl-L-alanine amidase [Verrucomicrobiaceae bacterium 227]
MMIHGARIPLLLAGLLTGFCFFAPTSCSSPEFTNSSLGIQKALIPKGRYGRHKTRSMRPRYITIHSTQNRSSGAGARTHARLIQRGGLKSKHNSLGYLTWHFTVDDHSIYQSLPTNVEGQHADYEGTGNRKSIGIEMCENAGNSRSATIARTARLTAELMKEYNIPLQNVVPHQHWRMIRYSDKKDLGHKNCPHFLLDNGKPGRKWQAFLQKVKSYL